MRIKNCYFLCKWLDKLVGITDNDARVEAIKQDTQNKIDATTRVVQQAGQLQSLVMKKTTTYYIGKAMGGKF